MGKYFGTDGFRGAANKNLTAKHAFEIGRFLGSYFKKDNNYKPKIVVGKDTRLSSYMLESAVASGLSSSGADVYLLHVTTTPSVAYVARTENFDCGIMITASHNVYSDNGIKLISSTGDKVGDDLTDLVENYLEKIIPEAEYATDNKIGKLIDYAAGRNRYIGYLISLAAHSYKGKNIGLDAANGSAWMIAKNVFNTLGANTYVINDTPSGENINDNCGSTHIKNLRELVIREKLDAGFAFDGDADRCMAIDENGNIVDGDAMMYILAKYMKSKDILPMNTVVATTMSNSGFVKSLENCGIACETTDVGDRFVRQLMAQKGYMLGGENSGHIIIGKYANTGDGILTAIMIMEVMSETKKSLSSLTEGLIMYPQKTESVRMECPDAALTDEDVLKLENKLNDTLLKEGRMLLRKSGTEPVVRIMAEGISEDITTRAINEMKALFKQKGFI